FIDASLPTPDPINWNSGTWYDPIYADSDAEAYDGRPALGGHNIMYDTDGNLLFFIIDYVIYNKEGWVIDVIGDRYGSGSYMIGESQYVIVPHATDCNKFYI